MHFCFDFDGSAFITESKLISCYNSFRHDTAMPSAIHSTNRHSNNHSIYTIYLYIVYVCVCTLFPSRETNTSIEFICVLNTNKANYFLSIRLFDCY